MNEASTLSERSRNRCREDGATLLSRPAKIYGSALLVLAVVRREYTALGWTGIPVSFDLQKARTEAHLQTQCR